MKGKAIIPLVLGLAVGLVAVRFLVDAVKKAQGANSEKQTITLVRAKHDIEAFSLLTDDMIEEVQTTDAGLVPATERLTSKEDLVKERRVVAKPVAQNTPLLKSMLAPPGTEPGLKGRIKEGFRAVSVKIDEVSGVAYQLKPGDYVDVIAVMDVQSPGSRKKQTIAETILQNIEVLAIGQETGGTTGGTDSTVKPAKSATLAVPEEEAPKLHLASTKGKITLSMRGEDSSVAKVEVVGEEVFDYAKLLGLIPKEDQGTAPPQPESIPVPVAEPPPPHGLVIFYGSTDQKGNKIERLTFENAHSRTIIGVGDGPVDRTGGSRSRRPTQSSLPYRPGVTPPTHRPDTDQPLQEEPSSEFQETE